MRFSRNTACRLLKNRDMQYKIWNLDSFANNTALIDEYNNNLSYHELKIESERVAKLLGRRCLVFCLCQNKIGSILGYVAFINNNIVPLLLNSNIDSDSLIRLMEIYKPAYLWIPEDGRKNFHDMHNMTEIYNIYDYTLLKTNYEREFDLYDQLALLLTTSGSTGSPKFVRQSYRNILSNALSIKKYLNLNESERPITTLPMNYTYGLSIINSHLLSGAAILVTDKTLMQKDFWDFMRRENATSLSGVPYTYEILDKLKFYRMNLPALRTLTQAGGKILPELQGKFARYAQENNKNFIIMYGQCEATARMSYLPGDKALTKNGSIGIAIPGGKFKLIDDNNQEITQILTPGELVYMGENVTLGYAESGEDLSKGDERRGVLKTGDIAEFDSDGYFYIIGRKKRFLKIYGNRVNLDEIDRLIHGKFNIESVSSGLDDKMYIFITDKNKNLAAQIKDFAANKTKLNPSAFKVVIIDEFPRSQSGKIMYNELRKYYDI